MKEKLVSVIITTYDRSWDEIEPSIKSVSNQRYQNLECIVVDDNGWNSERAIELKQRFRSVQMPLVYLQNEENQGAQYSRNRGILASHGDFLAFLDDDDTWESDKLLKQIPLFGDKKVGLVYCKGWNVYSSRHRIEPYNMSECFLDHLTFSDLSYGDYIGTTSQAVIRREVFATAGLFDVRQPARQDYEMWIRISQYYKCAGVNEYLFYHNHHEGNQITKNNEKAAIGIENIYNKYYWESSWTARWHNSYLTMKAWMKCQHYLKIGGYIFLTFVNFLLALLLDFSELRKRIEIHKTRK